MKRKEYEEELKRLQAKLCGLQEWVKYKGLRVVVVFEGRDAAGKGGTIKAITERVSPRVFRVVALPAPSDREKSQMYIQRYMQHFPAAGEIVIFDRSWYNRAGIEHVMGFCTEEQYRRFLELTPAGREGNDRQRPHSGQILARGQQGGAGAPLRGPHQRSAAPVEAQPDGYRSRWNRWDDYTKARDEMLEATDTPHAPWHIIRSDDKKSARLNCISHLLSVVPFEDVPRDKVKLPKRPKHDKYDPEAGLRGRQFVPQRY